MFRLTLKKINADSVDILLEFEKKLIVGGIKEGQSWLVGENTEELNPEEYAKEYERLVKVIANYGGIMNNTMNLVGKN